ncbi:MAG: hypothetical protein R2799_13695 [Crocinitomicaceae bacterium]
MSQEIIEMKSGDKLKVKIIEDLDVKIRYRKFKEPDGPIYVVYKKEITSITFEDGKVVQLTQNNLQNNDMNIDEGQQITGPEAEVLRIKEKSKIFNDKRHLIGFNYLQMVFLNISISYEFMFLKSGFFSFKIPIDIGMNVRNNYLKRNNIFTTGIDFNWYPMGQGRVAYFTGPAIRYSILADNPFFYNASSSDATRSQYIGFFINNGVLFQATSFLNFSLGTGIGIRKDLAREDEPTKFHMIFDASILFRL